MKIVWHFARGGGDDFEASVFQHLRDVLTEYWLKATLDPTFRSNGLRVQVVVRTAIQLVRTRRAMVDLANRILGRQLPGCRVTVLFYVEPRLAEPGYVVEIKPAGPFSV